MKSKLLLGIGLAAGYVLGTRSGRAAYEKMKAKATGIWESEPVQQKVAAATETIKEKAPEVADQLGEAARRAGTVIGHSVHRDSGEGAETAGSDTSGADTSPDTSGTGIPGHSTHTGTPNLNTSISSGSGAAEPTGYEAAEGIDKIGEEHDRAAEVAGSHAGTADVDSDPALNANRGQDWTNEGGATASGAATESGGPRES